MTPTTIEIKVYRFDELSGAAKDNARAWYREGAFNHDCYEAIYENFQRIAEILRVWTGCLVTQTHFPRSHVAAGFPSSSDSFVHGGQELLCPLRLRVPEQT